MRDLNRELDEYPDLPPESWKPKPGDRITGELVRYDQAESPFGPCWLAILRVAADASHGEYLAAVWLSHRVLLAKFKALRPKVGEQIGIKRLPDREGAKQTYANYAVVVDREGGGAPNWDALEIPEDGGSVPF